MDLTKYDFKIRFNSKRIVKFDENDSFEIFCCLLLNKLGKYYIKLICQPIFNELKLKLFKKLCFKPYEIKIEKFWGTHKTYISKCPCCNLTYNCNSVYKTPASHPHRAGWCKYKPSKWFINHLKDKHNISFDEKTKLVMMTGKTMYLKYLKDNNFELLNSMSKKAIWKNTDANVKEEWILKAKQYNKDYVIPSKKKK